MATTFTLVSSGPSLLVTFVPGVALAYALFWTTCWRQMPEPSRILPIYLIALAVQFLHFTEEYLTRFDIRFPGLWSAPAYPRDVFVGFNMVAYAAFTVGALILFYRVRAVAMVPLFFVAYGVIGNAIGHAAFCIGVRGYFPGFWTSLAYWVLGPLLLKRLWETRRRTLAPSRAPEAAQSWNGGADRDRTGDL